MEVVTVSNSDKYPQVFIFQAAENDNSEINLQDKFDKRNCDPRNFLILNLFYAN